MADTTRLRDLIPEPRRLACTIAMAAAFTLMTFIDDAPAREADPVEETASRVIGEPIMAIVSIKTQQITVYDAHGWTHRSPISSGMRGHETPAGIFAVVQKNAEHRSNLYDDAWMPHMQRLTWNGIALHGGAIPGHPASRGCVRLPYGFAERLFEKTRIGMRVIVSPNDTAPVEFAHPTLQMSGPEGIAAALANAEALDREAREAARNDVEARRASATAARQVALLMATIRRMEWLKARADAELAQEGSPPEGARADEAKARIEDVKLRAAAKAAEVGTQLEAARTDVRAKSDAADVASAAAKDAAARKAETAQAAIDAKAALEPLSIYISRATQTLYVRRNTRKPWADGGEVFDASIEVPIEIRNPEKPIGTHIFTATALKASGLQWTAVTIDAGDSASNALDRFSIPEDILNRIAAAFGPRSSIVISDEPLSRETNYRTEFVVVLSGHPQGGFVTRRPTVVSPSESYSAWRGGWR